MSTKTRNLTHAAIIAALYATLSHLQNLLLPGTASMAIQFRVAECLCVLAFFTAGAIPGLTLGCFLFNITSGAALPLDFLVGSLASFLAAVMMRTSRRITVKGIPVPGLLMPALINGILVGWELATVVGGGFWINCLYVAIGEAAVLLTLGTLLFLPVNRPALRSRLFGF